MEENFRDCFLKKNQFQTENQYNDLSDIEIDTKSFARLKSQNISPVIVPNDKRKNQFALNIFDPLIYEPQQIQNREKLKVDQFIQTRTLIHRPRKGSPVPNSRNESFIIDDQSLRSFQNPKKIAHQLRQVEMDSPFQHKTHSGFQCNESRNSSTIQNNENKFLFNPADLALLSKEHIYKVIDMIIDQKKQKDCKRTYIMKKINVFSHNYNQSLRQKVCSPQSRKKRIEKFQKQQKNQFTSVTTKKRKSKGCNCKNSKCLHRYCDCFKDKDYCRPSCICINCKNNANNEKLRKAAIQQKESKDPHAFLSVEQKLIIQGVSKNSGKKSSKNCNCKKSGCVKKYCNCFQQGMKCGRSCKCKGCENQKKKNQFINFYQ